MIKLKDYHEFGGVHWELSSIRKRRSALRRDTPTPASQTRSVQNTGY